MSNLVDIARQFYPPGIDTEDRAYRRSEQAKRLTAIIEALTPSMGDTRKIAVTTAARQSKTLGALADNYQRDWPRFLTALRERLPRCTIDDTTVPWHDPCYRCRISSTSASCELLVSVLAPIYTITGDVELVVDEARAALPLDLEYVPAAQLAARVPDLVPRTGTRALGKAVLGDLLFSSHVDAGW